ncbi:unnamed protein product [Microthlaspi erraticum]|uniref:TF-B3 domain-containing protein n=1 Tax=Microthlaspi erraticum TaxID=1685480 RepID=A0A6D2HGT0_9BRAS|nr:unnamed protein product [Microthlaspi erraticum]
MEDQVLQSPTNPHFFKPLLPGFHSHINIPMNFFSLHIEGRQERNTVELRSDACDKTWKVKMEGHRLTVGWKEFSRQHNFQTGDIIIFRHEGDLVFHVTGFGPSCCEIQYVQPCNNDDGVDDDQDSIRNLSTMDKAKTEPVSSQDDDDKDNMGNIPRKKHTKKRNLAEAKYFSSDESCFVATITDSNLREDKVFLPRKFVRPDGLKKSSSKIVLMNERQRTWTLTLKFRKSTKTFYMGTGWRSFCHENGLQTGDWITFKLERNNTRTPFLCFSSVESKSVSTKESRKEKRIKTGESSQRVSLSSSPQSENRLVTLTVKPASLKKGRLHLPMSFTRVNRMETAGGKKITMLDKHGVDWPVNLVMERKNGMMRLGSGIKDFLKANGVKVFEPFVLELVWEDKTSPPMLKFCSKIKT